MSLSASAENLSTESQNYDGSSSMCLELALEGERLCKAGDCRAGVAFFQAAIQAGTDDLRTLSAIYSQLGNAYFYLGDYPKAMQYHKHDLTLARTMGDKLGEAKSSGNLGNTLKVMGRFDEAVLCCKRHLELSRELEDRLSEGRALYNLGNVYHAKGKHIGRVGHQDPGEFPDDVKNCLQQAVTYYEENLTLMRDLGDVAAQGRACGNLGNTHYLLGDFAQAIRYHEERLSIARQFGDRAAERRAHSNLGNSHIFLGQFEDAAHHYKRTLVLAQELGDRAVEAQACYSLGNTYTLLRDYETAIEYHLRHLMIAQHLGDRVGEGRACWSLGNAHAALGNHEKALYFASKHLEISKESCNSLSKLHKYSSITLQQRTRSLQQLTLNRTPVSEVLRSATELDRTYVRLRFGKLTEPNVCVSRISEHCSELIFAYKCAPSLKPWLDDPMGQATAKMNITDLRKVLGLTDSGLSPEENSKSPDLVEQPQQQQQSPTSSTQTTANNSILQVSTPTTTTQVENTSNTSNPSSRIHRLRRESMEQLNLIKLTPDGKPRPPGKLIAPIANSKTTPSPSKNEDEDSFFDLLSKFQSKRMDDQRCSLQVDNKENTNPVVNIPNGNNNNYTNNNNNERPDDLLDMIVGMQSKRMDEQRVALPHLPGLQPASLQRLAAGTTGANHAPDDSFLEMLARCQGSRLEDQRSPLPATAVAAVVDVESEATPAVVQPTAGATVPDEDFFTLIMRLQSGRMEDQRATVPLTEGGALPNGPMNGTNKKKK